MNKEDEDLLRELREVAQIPDSSVTVEARWRDHLDWDTDMELDFSDGYVCAMVNPGHAIIMAHRWNSYPILVKALKAVAEQDALIRGYLPPGIIHKVITEALKKTDAEIQ